VVAYLIMSYTHPELVQRLVARLRADSPGATIAVHHDSRRCALGPLDALRIEPPSPIEWGHGSQLAAVLRCLRWVHEHSPFDWLVLLSGQDYPIRRVAEIETELAAAEEDAFILTAPVPPLRLRRGAVDEFARRYRYRWRRVPARLGGLIARADPVLQVRSLPSGTYAGLPWRPPLAPFHGSDWFTLSRRAVEAVLAAPATHFMRTIIPTEAFVHTVLANDRRFSLRNDHRRYARFDPPGSANPRVLGLADVDAAIATGGHFARKFEDARVLDAIDRRVHDA
jgi:hypothetical protein